MQQVENDIRDIKVGMEEHNEADDKRFEQQNNKLDKIIDYQQEFRDTQLINHEVIKTIKSDTGKTNGRVTLLEDTVAELATANKLLHQIVSQQHNQYEKWVTQQEAFNTNKLVNKDEFFPVKILVFGMTGIILTGVIGAIMTLVLK